MDFLADKDSWSFIFNTGPICVIKYKNEVGRWPIVQVTENFEKLTGWTEGEFQSGKKVFADVIHPDDIARIVDEENVWLDAEYENNDISNYRIVTKSGEVRHVCEYAHITSDEENLVGYILDIESVRDEEILRLTAEAEEAKSLLHEAVGAMAEGLIVNDATTILDANDRVRQLLEIPEAFLAEGRAWEDFITFAADRGDFGDEMPATKIIENIRSDINAGVPRTHEHIINGERFVRASIQPRSAGKGAVITFTDLTEDRKREAELDQARRSALAADKAKSEFLANMSHEIRTPMNGVMGMAELLLRSRLEPKQKMFADTIVRSGTSLLTIINDILDFSKIDAGQMVLAAEPFQLADAIDDVAALLSSHAAEKNLELIVRIDPGLPGTYLGDVGRLRQIVTNLAGNAVKFTSTGHVYIDVSGEPVDGSRGRLRFRIEDTGEGIPQEKLNAVFEKFHQADNSASRAHEGTGLGLSIASSLVNLMGGEIGVESELGTGSTFWFTVDLPVVEAEKPRTKLPTDIKGSRILIVDDNSVNRSILAEQMDLWQLEHAEMSSGADGLRFIEEAHQHGLDLDLVILDYHMPGMDGIGVLKQLRSDPATAKLPVIMLTSVDTAAAPAELGHLRLEAKLTKPTRSSLLLETIVEVLNQAGEKGNGSKPSSLADLLSGMDRSGALDRTSKDHIRAESARHSSGETASHSAEVSTEFKTTGPLDILIAEDNEVNQRVFSQILYTTPYSHTLVENGELAVASWRENKPKLILMDVSMPVMNGHEAARAIRAEESGTGEHVTIIGITAHALNGDKETCFDAGMDDYLPKPISVGALTDMLAKHLDEDETADRQKTRIAS